MLNANEFKAAIVRKGLTQKEVADSLNISAKTLSNRISKGVLAVMKSKALWNF